MSKAADEMSHWAEYDYVIVNEDLQKSLTTARTILRAERQKRRRQPALKQHVARLLAE